MEGRGVDAAIQSTLRTDEAIKNNAREPSTPEGAAALQAVGKPMQMAQAGAGAAGEYVGGAKGRALGEMVPEGAALALGAKNALTMRGAAIPAKPMSQAREAIAASQKKGFMADPVEANPGIANTVVEGIADRKGVQNRIAAKNADQAAALVKKDLGLAADARLDEPTIQGIRAKAGQKYQAIKDLQIDVPMDQAYLDTIHALDEKFASLKEFAPELYNHPSLERVRGALTQPKSPAHGDNWTPKSILEISQALRDKANRVLKGRDISDEAYHEAIALKSGATAMEDLLERHLVPTGPQRLVTNFRLVDDFKKARALIAKSYDAEAATNLTSGAVDPQVLRKLHEKGSPLSGGLKDVADAAAAMPSVMKSVEGLDTSLAPHVGDWGAAGMSALALHRPELLAGAFVRPAARVVAASKPYQAAMGQARPGKPARQIKMAEAAKAAALEQQATQNEAPDH
jgi:hypothetical protein